MGADGLWPAQAAQPKRGANTLLSMETLFSDPKMEAPLAKYIEATHRFDHNP